MEFIDDFNENPNSIISLEVTIISKKTLNSNKSSKTKKFLGKNLDRLAKELGVDRRDFENSECQSFRSANKEDGGEQKEDA